ncbi:hypothetical protein MRX96_051403 [Rhipicephalus microplus]
MLQDSDMAMHEPHPGRQCRSVSFDDGKQCVITTDLDPEVDPLKLKTVVGRPPTPRPSRIDVSVATPEESRSLGPALLTVCCGGLDSRLVAALSLPALVRALEVGERRGGLGRPAVPVCQACAAVLSSRSQALALSAKSRT